MTDWAVCKEHRAADITLLCDSHHREVTNGLMTPQQVADADSSPVNVVNGVSAPYGLHLDGGQFRVEIGGNTMVSMPRSSQGYTDTSVVSVDDIDLLSFRVHGDGHLALNAVIFDDCNAAVLVIAENVLRYKTEMWDVAFVGKTLTLREKARQVLIEIEFEPPDLIVVNRASLLCNGVEICVSPDHVHVLNCNVRLSNATAINCRGGLILGRNQRGLGGLFSLAAAALPRYYGTRKRITS